MGGDKKFFRFSSGGSKRFIFKLGIARKMDIDSKMQYAHLDYVVSVIVPHAQASLTSFIKCAAFHVFCLRF